MAKNAVAKSWSLPTTGGRRYSDPDNAPSEDPPVAPTITAGTLTGSTFPINISGGSGATSWTAQIKLDSEEDWLTDSTLTVGVASHTYSGLDPETTYDVRVRAQNAYGTTYSNTLTDTTDAAGGGVVASLTAQRLSGPAPLGIVFDATGTTSSNVSDEFREPEFSFDFDDPSSGTFTLGSGLSKNTQVGGPVAAHVFETPGTYTVTVDVDDGTGTDSASIEVTVEDPDSVYPGTQTICIDSTGGTSGGPAGAQYVTTMPGTVLSNRRYLFKRGHTHTAAPNVPMGVSNVYFGAYGSGADPILTGNITGGESSSSVAFVHTVVITGLRLNSVTLGLCPRRWTIHKCGTPPGVEITSPFIGQVDLGWYSGGYTWYTNPAAAPMSLANHATPSLLLWPQETIVSENDIVSSIAERHNPIYYDGMYSASIGNSAYRAGEHQQRSGFQWKSVIAHNYYRGASNGGWGHDVKLHACGYPDGDYGIEQMEFAEDEPTNPHDKVVQATRFVVIANNRFGSSDDTRDWTTGCGPQNGNDEAVEGISDVIWENNIYGLYTSRQQDIHVSACRRITARGNVTTSGGAAIANAGRMPLTNGWFPSGDPRLTYMHNEWNGPYYGFTIE